ncbi:MAG TPA: hypothetical protein V6C78_13970 [Crinalium sp.]
MVHPSRLRYTPSALNWYMGGCCDRNGEQELPASHGQAGVWQRVHRAG